MTTQNPTTSGNRQNQRLHFRCSDVGPKSCDWQTSGSSEDEILSQAEQHGRQAHNLNIDDNTRRQVRNAIQREAA